jgi:hypothetical protein
MRSRQPLNDELLRSAGVVKPGHRARLLAHLEEASIGKQTARRKDKMVSRFAPAPEPGVV